MTEDQSKLKAEKMWIYLTLMLVSGFYGAYTYSIRGGVFSNAQTANFVLLAMEIGRAQWKKALYYVVPISSYLLGIIISEAVYEPIKKLKIIRWETLLILIEIGIVIFLGLLPESAPYQIAQISINFICSMQFNTFRQTMNLPMATTFCTNHLKQIGNNLVRSIRTRDKISIRNFLIHSYMVFSFLLGAILGTILCDIFLGKSIFATLIPLTIILINFLYSDLKSERDKLEINPKGH